MSVNLRRFVNLNVSRTKRNIINPVRDTVALYGSEADFKLNVEAGVLDVHTNAVFTAGTLVHDASGAVTGYHLTGYDYADKSIDRSLTIKFSAEPAIEDCPLYWYAKTFFDNGGAKLHIYFGAPQMLGCKLNIKTGNVDQIVPDEEILVAYLSIDYNQGGNLETLAPVANAYNAALNPDSTSVDAVPNLHTSAAKIFIGYVESYTAIDDGMIANITLPENLAVKYDDQKQAAEMTIAAYLTRINVYGDNTVNDYNFTIENVKDAYNDDTIIANCMSRFVNVDTTLAKAVRNVGGDLVTGFDLVNYYVTIILQQTCEEVVINALSDKLAGAEGTAVIYNTVVSELNKYVRCGLLSAGNWEDIDWVEEYNDESYVVVNANERVTLGYKVLVVPFAAMTQEQVAAHQCPPIYIAMINKYGIRKVVLRGEVR